MSERIELQRISVDEIKVLLRSMLEASETFSKRIKELLSAIEQKSGFGFTEANFQKLTWEKRNSKKIGDFEVAQRDGSSSFDYCFRLLKEQNAFINNKFSSEGWSFSYWIFKDAIYRQKRKESSGGLPLHLRE